MNIEAIKDSKCPYCETGCKACDARFSPETPFAWFHYEDFTMIFHDVWEELIEGHDDWVPLYTNSQPKREWVGFSEKEKTSIMWTDSTFAHGVEWAEVKLKEKNT